MFRDAVLVLLAVEAAALADRSLELAGGVAVPVATESWQRGNDPGWKIAGRGVGQVRGQLAVVGLELARIPYRYCGTFDRLRLTAGLAGRWSLEHVAISARLAVGADGVSCVHSGPPPLIAGLPRESRHFDLGIAAEAAATLWLIEGVVDVGIEVGMPLAFHWYKGHQHEPQFDYLAIDLDVLLAIRVR